MIQSWRLFRIKVFLDQGGDDRNQLSKILAMSDQEFHALADPEPGQCLIVWGDKILQCDSKISRDNPLYQFYTTNFHEAARENRNVFYEFPESEEFGYTEEEDDISIETISREEVPEEIQAYPEISREEEKLIQCVEEAQKCGEELAALLCGTEVTTAERLLEGLCARGILTNENGSYRRTAAV